MDNKVDLEYALGPLPLSSVRPNVYDLYGHDRARVEPVLAAIAARPTELIPRLRTMFVDALDSDDPMTQSYGLHALRALRGSGYDVDVAGPRVLELYASHRKEARDLLSTTRDPMIAQHVLRYITGELQTTDPFEGSRAAHLLAWCAWVCRDAEEFERFATDPWFAIRDGAVGALLYAVYQDVRRADALVRLVPFLRDPAGCIQNGVVYLLQHAARERYDLAPIVDALRAAQGLGGYDTEEWLHGPLDSIARSDLHTSIGDDVRELLDNYFLATVE